MPGITNPILKDPVGAVAADSRSPVAATSPVVAPASIAVSAEARVLSLDAMRGFALSIAFFCIPVVQALSRVPPSGLRDFLIRHLTHTRWNGISFLDVGYPAFLCITGISLSLSFSRRLARAQTKSDVFCDLVRKSLFCMVFAFFFNGGFSIPWGRIDFEQIFFIYALTVLVAGTLQLLFGARVHLLIVLLLTAVYSGATLYGTHRYFGTTHPEPKANFDEIVTQAFPTHFLYFYAWFFPRMVLPCLCGLLIGNIYQSHMSPQKKVWWLIGIGYGLVNVGMLLDVWIPINRVLWTPSYALYSVGITCFFLAGFFQAIEIWGIRRLAMPWVVFGWNPLAAWGAYHLVPFKDFAQRVAGYALVPLLGVYNEVFLAFMQVALCWLCFYWLYRRGISIRL